VDKTQAMIQELIQVIVGLKDAVHTLQTDVERLTGVLEDRQATDKPKKK
jgi:hypothetical protein